MRVVVSTIARFHHFDLARELQKRDLLTAIYTGYPQFKLRNSGVDPSRIRSFPWLQAPYMALLRWPWFARTMEGRWSNWAHRALDAHVARTLPECDLVVAQCRIGVKTGAAARKRGIVYVCDPGSTHILYQDRLLREEHERLGFPYAGIDSRAVERDLAEYELADAITVPSSFVRDSFLAEGVPAEKLILAPYGVDRRIFGRTAPRAEEFRVLFVGQLGVRKGLHHLLRAFRKAALPNARLVLIGSLLPEGRAILAREPVAGLTWLGHQPWSRVVHEMSRASVFVLPSIEEGLALVQAQAMACGCPVIASEHTGSRDLFHDGREGFILPVGDTDAMADRLRRLYEDRDLLAAMSSAALERTAAIGGWDEYGRRLTAAYAALLKRDALGPPGRCT
ncbi:glycosyltransferase [Azospirillum sp. B506]|uniref:glycosyltransferase n=1 Tax=Azospirillum sp. B506 TaxID=137721 RepID=UPI0003482665|nr:glycosyltransferase [Azospirillum sp. B506]